MNLLLCTIFFGLLCASVKCGSYGSDLRFANLSHLTRSIDSNYKPFMSFIEVDLADDQSLVYAVNEKDSKSWSIVYHYNISSGYQMTMAGIEIPNTPNLTPLINSKSNASEAYFNYLTRGTQINATHIVIPEKWFNCLRLFDRSEGIVSVLGPACGGLSQEDNLGLLGKPLAVAAAAAGDRLFILSERSYTLSSLDLATLNLKPMYRQLQVGNAFGHYFVTNTLGTVGYLFSDNRRLVREGAGLYEVPLFDHDEPNNSTGKDVNKHWTKLLSVKQNSTDISGALITADYRNTGRSTNKTELTIPEVHSMNWLVKDEVLIAGSGSLYILVDLRQNSMTSWCLKKDTKQFSQILRNVSECDLYNGGVTALNSRTAQLFLTNYTLDSLKGYNRTIDIIQTEYQQLQCDTSYLLYNGSNVLNNVTSPGLLSKLKFGCEQGFALIEDDDTVQCVADETSLYWTPGFPTCQSVSLDDQQISMFPVVGHIGGGYNVSVKGHFPLELNMSVRLIAEQTIVDAAVVSRSRHEMRFIIPEHHHVVPTNHSYEVQVEISLGNNTKRLDFEYTPLPVLENTDELYSSIRTGLKYTIDFKLKTQYDYTYSVQLPGNFLDCSPILNVMNSDETMVKCTINQETSAVGVDDQMVLFVGNYPIFTKNVTLQRRPQVDNIVIMENSPDEDNSNVNILRLRITGSRFSPEFSYYSILLTKPRPSNNSELSAPASNHSYSYPYTYRKKRELSAPDTSCKIIDRTDGSMTVDCFASAGMKAAELQVNFGGSEIMSETIEIPETTDIKTAIIASTTVIAVLAICGLIAIGFLCYKKRHAPQTTPFNMLVNSAYFTRTPDDSLAVEFNVIIQTKICHMLIPPSKIKYNKLDCIGQGQFGSVLKGTYHSEHGVIDVALKTLTEGCTSAAISRFCEEASIMFHFNHPHVLSNIGVVEGHPCPLVVLPYMPNRDLRAMLLNEQLHFTQGDLVHFGLQIAKGMEYLSNKQFVHRDLATRNCLVTEDYVIKIADFGLSRDIYRHEYYKIGEKSDTPLPVKWMAIESLERGVYSSASDVWSFGVVLWELLTRGAVPYAHLTNFEAIAHVKQGLRLPKPADCFQNLYDLMRSCWFDDPTTRPNFSLLVTYLRSALYGCNIEKDDYVRVLTKNLTDMSLALTRAVSEQGINSISIHAGDKRLKNFKLPPLMIPCNKDKKNKSKPFPFSRQLSYSYSDTDLLLQASPGSRPITPKMI